jgi:hypothetical protein
MLDVLKLGEIYSLSQFIVSIGVTNICYDVICIIIEHCFEC